MKSKFPQHKVVSTDSLIPYALNSRTHSDAQVSQIAASIKEFGFLNPIIIDGANGIIAGHGRVLAAQKLGMKELPVVEASHLTDAQRKAYVIADNKLALNADWNEKKLFTEITNLLETDFEIELLGFTDNELAKLLGEDNAEIVGDIVFSEELGEAHNYVVVYFDNDMDWLAAQTHFDLPSVHSKRQNGKPWSKGIGRVISGSDYLSKIK